MSLKNQKPLFLGHRQTYLEEAMILDYHVLSPFFIVQWKYGLGFVPTVLKFSDRPSKSQILGWKLIFHTISPYLPLWFLFFCHFILLEYMHFIGRCLGLFKWWLTCQYGSAKWTSRYWSWWQWWRKTMPMQREEP